MNFAFFFLSCSSLFLHFYRHPKQSDLLSLVKEEAFLVHVGYLAALCIFAAAVKRVYGAETSSILLFLLSLLHPTQYPQVFTPVNLLILLSFALFLRVYNRLAMCILTISSFLYPKSVVLLIGYGLLITVQKPSYFLHLAKPVIATALIIALLNHFWLEQSYSYDDFKFRFEAMQFFNIFALTGISTVLFPFAWIARYPPFKFSFPSILYLLFSFLFSAHISTVLPVLLLLTSSLLAISPFIR